MVWEACIPSFVSWHCWGSLIWQHFGESGSHQLWSKMTYSTVSPCTYSNSPWDLHCPMIQCHKLSHKPGKVKSQLQNVMFFMWKLMKITVSWDMILCMQNPCAYHEGVSGRKCTAPLILYLSTWSRWIMPHAAVGSLQIPYQWGPINRWLGAFQNWSDQWKPEKPLVSLRIQTTIHWSYSLLPNHYIITPEW